MSAKYLTAGTITTDLLHASVGQELEIGSNRALLLYATEDGFRPSGGLKTKVANGDGTYREISEGDSFIEIAAAQTNASGGTDPAHIDIMTSGVLNLYSGSNMNLLSSSNINIDSESALNLTGGTININAHYTYNEQGEVIQTKSGTINLFADSAVNIKSGSNISMATGGTFTLASNNVIIDRNGNALFKGTLYAWAGNIAGFTIAYDNESETDERSTPVSRQNSYTRQYIYAGGTSTVHSTDPGVYIGTDGLNLGGKLKYDLSNLIVTAQKVFIGNAGSFLSLDSTDNTATLAAQSTVNITAGSTINISSGKTVNIVTTGTVQIGNTGSPFTIGAGTASYIYNGMTSLNSTSSGVYIGTDGIAVGGGNFKVTSGGSLYINGSGTFSGDGIFGGTIYASAGRIGATKGTDGYEGGWTINSNLITANSGSTGLNADASPTTNVAIWAGNTTGTSAPFYVTHNGYLHSTSGTIGGWTIGEHALTNTGSTIGMYSGTSANSGSDVVAFWAGSASPTSSNFYVTYGGVLHATNAIIGGTITATSGSFNGTITAGAGSTIGGWYISSDRIQSEVKSGNITYYAQTGMASNVANDNNIVFWAGTTTAKESGTGYVNYDPTKAPFYVTAGGSVKVSGNITATSGKIGSYTISTINQKTVLVGDSVTVNNLTYHMELWPHYLVIYAGTGDVTHVSGLEVSTPTLKATKIYLNNQDIEDLIDGGGSSTSVTYNKTNHSLTIDGVTYPHHHEGGISLQNTTLNSLIEPNRYLKVTNGTIIGEPQELENSRYTMDVDYLVSPNDSSVKRRKQTIVTKDGDVFIRTGYLNNSNYTWNSWRKLFYTTAETAIGT